MFITVHKKLKAIVGVFSLIMSLFFLVLAVYDGLEEEKDIEYFGEFVDEAEFDYIDFPTSISRPSGNKVNQVQRLELVKIFDQILTILRREPIIQPKLKLADYFIINIPILLFEHIISTHAP